ncbi:hypothetical protein OAK06_03565 [Gammaproteobacteria bacterium]|nr:hypothetical protein [Gammaproteobacteria bacterium]
MLLSFFIFIAGCFFLTGAFIGIFKYLQISAIKDEGERKQSEDKRYMEDWKNSVEKNTKLPKKDKERMLRQIKVYGAWSNKHLTLGAFSLGFITMLCLMPLL